MSSTTVNDPRRGFVQKARRLAPIAVILAAIFGAFALGLDDYLSFEALRDNREILMAFTADNVIAAVAIFIGIYAVSTALSLPGGAVLSIAGGFLFGSFLGTLWVVLGATIGAVGIFLAARTALGDILKAKAGPWLMKMEAGFQENALSYLLVLRLVPLFPFVVVNLVPAFLGVSLRTFTLATFIGIIPGSFVFASIGAGLGSVFDRGDSFSPTGILTPEVIVALLGLSVLSLVPVVYKRIKTSRKAS
ncbi:TVP38/TMEM64 family protein [Pelagibius sp. Alg239-R121]|uniref:TVP38/TMEM64 family protein n=1 Tax=Pelagibius sp. Alg239-R121 TaxID=2993448 RepID=UPI0024A670EE|nr:TVP38/TMEM64 family protein [Pelagibius sp. Alg239-R121]